MTIDLNYDPSYDYDPGPDDKLMIPGFVGLFFYTKNSIRPDNSLYFITSCYIEQNTSCVVSEIYSFYDNKVFKRIWHLNELGPLVEEKFYKDKISGILYFLV